MSAGFEVNFTKRLQKIKKPSEIAGLNFECACALEFNLYM